MKPQLIKAMNNRVVAVGSAYCAEGMYSLRVVILLFYV